MDHNDVAKITKDAKAAPNRQKQLATVQNLLTKEMNKVNSLTSALKDAREDAERYERRYKEGQSELSVAIRAAQTAQNTLDNAQRVIERQQQENRRLRTIIESAAGTLSLLGTPL